MSSIRGPVRPALRTVRLHFVCRRLHATDLRREFWPGCGCCAGRPVDRAWRIQVGSEVPGGTLRCRCRLRWLRAVGTLTGSAFSNSRTVRRNRCCIGTGRVRIEDCLHSLIFCGAGSELILPRPENLAVQSIRLLALGMHHRHPQWRSRRRVRLLDRNVPSGESADDLLIRRKPGREPILQITIDLPVEVRRAAVPSSRNPANSGRSTSCPIQGSHGLSDRESTGNVHASCKEPHTTVKTVSRKLTA